jgi:hypothetical protein
MIPRQRRRREVQVRDHTGHPPQDLLRVRAPLVATAQPRFDVPDGDPLEEADQRTEEDRRGVALDEHHAAVSRHHGAQQPLQAAVRDVVEVLPVLHDAEVVIDLESNTRNTWSSRSVCCPVSTSRDSTDRPRSQRVRAPAPA